MGDVELEAPELDDVDEEAGRFRKMVALAVAQAVADLTPIDPSNEADLASDIASRNRRPDQARLRQTIGAELANDHGGKADSYVAVLTVLAVSLFLLGLSLTVEGRNKYV